MKKKSDGRINNGRRLGTTKNKVSGEIAKKENKLGSVKKDKSDHHAKTTDEILKVKKGETQKEWENRVKRNRVIKLDNYSTQRYQEVEFMENGKIVFRKRKLTGQHNNLKKTINAQYREMPFDYMRNYALIMRYITVKYDILQSDIELGYYFYDEAPFTKDYFNQVCAQLGLIRGVFSRFYKSGYICGIEVDMGGKRDNLQTKLYALSTEFGFKIRDVYKIISGLTPLVIRDEKGSSKLYRDDYDTLYRMYLESKEIIKGIKKPEKIRFRNETDEE